MCKLTKHYPILEPTCYIDHLLLEVIYSLCKLFIISIISLQLVKQESLKVWNFKFWEWATWWHTRRWWRTERWWIRKRTVRTNSDTRRRKRSNIHWNYSCFSRNLFLMSLNISFPIFVRYYGWLSIFFQNIEHCKIYIIHNSWPFTFCVYCMEYYYRVCIIIKNI